MSVTTGTVTKGARTQIGILSPTPHGIPAGGTDGQVLTKTSGTDYAAAWEDAAGGGGIDAEAAVDAVAAALVAGNNIDITYNDAAGTITVDVETLTTADITGLDTALAGKQPLDTDLTTIAGLTATTDNVIQSVSSTWASRTPAQLKTTLALVKGDVGLGNVDNTADTAKPVSHGDPGTGQLDGQGPDPAHVERARPAPPTPRSSADENLMVTLSNASAITVTLPAELGGRVPGRRRSRLPLVGCRPTDVRRRAPAPPSTPPPA